MSDFNYPVLLEESKYHNSYQAKISLKSGNFYIFDGYLVGEVREGFHFDWDSGQELINKVYEHFGSNDVQIAYISNRVYSYSVQPKDWLNFFKERHKLKCVAIVAYNKQGLLSLVLEKIFSQTPYRKFKTLDEAIDWVITSDFPKLTP